MKTIQKMFEHLYWANERILETLQKNNVEEQQLRLFTHILNAEQVWLTRLQGMDSSQMPIWSEGDLTVCAKLIKQNEESFKAFLTEIAETDLDNLITYTNSTGNTFTSSIRDILTHVALHGQYHRGQINSRLRAEGFEPISTDYIIFVR
ncbi:putative damage-inducible protein DinB [Paenibacillus castaneae]|uniref:DinB family protein n=1 Tax=Paenibacillus castaneae TaxID=474957 RepID=UPI000C9BC87E|nr:DinB family protein [Paenibacillus castaneae]NIK76491.1 putative damage-inducible protein DinB [Paenibacillus castaneae]